MPALVRPLIKKFYSKGVLEAARTCRSSAGTCSNATSSRLGSLS